MVSRSEQIPNVRPGLIGVRQQKDGSVFIWTAPGGGPHITLTRSEWDELVRAVISVLPFNPKTATAVETHDLDDWYAEQAES